MLLNQKDLRQLKALANAFSLLLNNAMINNNTLIFS